MLIDRVRALALAISATEERATNLGRIQAIQSSAEKLSERLAELKSLVAWRGVLLKRNVSVPQGGSASRVALEALQKYGQLLAQDPLSAADPVAINQVLLPLNYSLSESRATLTSTWEAYVTARMPALNTLVLSVLRGIPSLRDRTNRLDRCLRSLESWRIGLPTDASAVQAFDKAVDEAEKIWHQLGGDELGPDVSSFLQQTGVGGASLDQLTPAISEWLRHHKIWNSFRITLARDTPPTGYRDQ